MQSPKMEYNGIPLTLPILFSKLTFPIAHLQLSFLRGVPSMLSVLSQWSPTISSGILILPLCFKFF